ncbi:MAG: efflux RND transporter permease subunit [Alphaproteobacteria bacterium]|nr:efflux RND transporter permease subunit [Alphaproteobacteria bacterium]
MARFFVDRPVFAWVVALFVILAGVLSLQVLPIAQYPTVAPPSVNITATFPGASAALLDQAVTSLIETELNGADGLMYVESQSQANGTAQIVATFQPGTDPDLAAVDVQNRMKKVEPRLPQEVKQQGIEVTKASSSFLVVVSLLSTDGTRGRIELGDYIYRNVIDEIRRIPGVGQARVFGSEKAMRIWLDPAALVAHELTPADVTAAIRAQNLQISAGGLGDLPTPSSQQIATSIVATGQLDSPDAFRDIILRGSEGGGVVRLGDVATVEIGGVSYAVDAYTNGAPSAAFAVQLSPTGNALQTARDVEAKMHDLERYFPPGVTWEMTIDNAQFISLSIEEVVRTLLEAILLVFLVMYLFLQDFRATLIPTIVVPVALLGALATMQAFGFSINVLTMFGLVLAIGIVVDDAIVVVENVERIMAAEGLSPRDATHKAMGQITGAILGITLVLCSVFVPMAFFGGAVGKIYQQFSLSMVAAIVFSALMALSLTPALCATMLRPGHTEGSATTGPLGWFNRQFERLSTRYHAGVGRLLARTGRALVAYAAIVAFLGVLYVRLPSAFLPLEDQGTLITLVTLPPGASANRTKEVMDGIDQWWLDQEGVDRVLSIRGFSYSGSGQNAGLILVRLSPWDERDADHTSQAIAARANRALSSTRDAIVFALNPPPIRELGTSSGFSFRLQDRGNLGHDALVDARNRLLAAAGREPGLTRVRADGLEDTPQLQVTIDRRKASALGVPFSAISTTLSTALGSAYANDFPNDGRQQRVLVQVAPDARARPDDIGDLYVRNDAGGMVPLAELVTTSWTVAPVQMVRYNGYPAMKITGEATEGSSTGAAMATMERLASDLGPGIGFEWTGTSLEEKTSGAQVPALLTLSLLAVFLCLAALYESWSVPLSVLLVVPLGILGAVLATSARGLPNDVYFKVGLIAIIGLSAKNAILIVEFAKELQEDGMDAVQATLEAARLRFRPILMTSMAFILGVVPLVIASGAGSASQRAIGTAVMGGMVAATVLAVYLVPVFFVVVRGWGGWRARAPDPSSPVTPHTGGVEEVRHA